jgi:hypothetical protein
MPTEHINILYDIILRKLWKMLFSLKNILFQFLIFFFQLNFLVTGGHDGSRERNLSVGNIGEKLNIVSIETYKYNNDSMVRNLNKLEPKLFV